MYSLPTTVTVGDEQYKIRNSGDFRMVLDCFAALQDKELDNRYKVLTALIIFYEKFSSLSDFNTEKNIEPLVKEMFKFMNGGQDEPETRVTRPKVIRWEQDSQIICAAVNKVANQEIRALDYLHWWTFLGYYMSVGESVLSTVVNIRDKIARNKKLEKWEKEYRRDNPQYFVTEQTEEDREMEDYLRNLWKKG